MARALEPIVQIAAFADRTISEDQLSPSSGGGRRELNRSMHGTKLTQLGKPLASMSEPPHRLSRPRHLVLPTSPH